MHRKRVRLIGYDYASAGQYYVTICTRDRLPILEGPLNRVVSTHVGDLSTRFPGVVVDEAIVMSDHVHIILSLNGKTVPLPRVIQAFKSLTTLETPERLRPLWQRGYYEHIIRDEYGLNVVRDYIRNNVRNERGGRGMQTSVEHRDGDPFI